MFYLLFMLLIFITTLDSLKIEKSIANYFSSDIISSMQKDWQKQKDPFENAVVLSLQDSYGHKSLNIYMRRSKNSNLISRGFFLSDNIINLVFLNMQLQSIPDFKFPRVKMALGCNVMWIEAGVSKIYVSTDYLLFRNQSQILYPGSDQNPYMNSPFTFQQVQGVGKLIIIAEDCSLNGRAILRLRGQSVNVAHNTFKLTGCKFTVEIHIPGSGSPPVIAPYFSKEQGIQLERLISKPLQDELLPKLQGTLFGFVNTSSVFGDKLSKYRQKQNYIFLETWEYMTEVVRNLNILSIKENKGTVDMQDMEVFFTKTFKGKDYSTSISLNNMTLNGLDTAYCAHVGGPFKSKSIKIAEAIRYNNLQVRGLLHFENSTHKGQYDFAAELLDVTVDLTINVESMKRRKANQRRKVVTRSEIVHNFEYRGWRSMEFFILELETFARERIASRALVTGYLINEVPKTLIKHLADVFMDAIMETDNQRNGKNKVLDNYSEENRQETSDIKYNINDTISGIESDVQLEESKEHNEVDAIIDDNLFANKLGSVSSDDVKTANSKINTKHSSFESDKDVKNVYNSFDKEGEQRKSSDNEDRAVNKVSNNYDNKNVLTESIGVQSAENVKQEKNAARSIFNSSSFNTSQVLFFEKEQNRKQKLSKKNNVEKIYIQRSKSSVQSVPKENESNRRKAIVSESDRESTFRKMNDQL